MNKKAYIIILNWNGWKDTIECLESVFQNLYSDYRVVLCDNASTDKSLDKIKQWADGTLKSHVADDVRIDVHVNLPVIQQ